MYEEQRKTERKSREEKFEVDAKTAVWCLSTSNVDSESASF